MSKEERERAFAASEETEREVETSFARISLSLSPHTALPLARALPKASLPLHSHLQERLSVPRIAKSHKSKASARHDGDVREGAELGRVLAERLDRRPVRDTADEELAGLV